MAVGAGGTTLAQRPYRRIQATRGFTRLDLAEFWRYRELLVALIWRDIRVRYKQTFLGPVWAILRPFIQTVVFTLVFNGVANIQSGSRVPYQLFSFVGIAAWTYFGSALSGGALSILGNSSVMSKIYFPRIYVALTAVLAPLVDLALSLVAGSALFLYYGMAPGRNVVFAPLFLLLELVIALGLGFWLAPVTARYRDVPFALPFITQLWMFVTPVAYPLAKLLQLLPANLHWVSYVNPLTAPIVGFRWALVGGEAPGFGAVVSSVGIGVALVVTGFVWFRQAERSIADVF